ncbi:hypothetical protein GUITHDRAFT_133507 [Guillardia theta CCMP2712]|uniref:T-cell immunomodulatory protein TIP C2 domain-containing protein n=2 Tax=Guillardia theta TaxID=55529 RepID=L1JV22_GUITC|nr:hypothetical protein GUITHDRAFT_133507 [Guillardia theta CCMP2712]EKX52411.1 hypothetical protein GUITHDRAFT_133507 [Guillardia theta CCMP2712]|mmetsp:Transcript_27454/g.89457  ORF Transcript_27454/g.89457 Transcript_27454/m.89457 type:complete len:727 (+) Transcript_27454:197-2377(+)|eukprot:XP_005839391.1 hypothetical protein GUITHDRAFT_133507 [Guillardia theta CCMP2712]
MSGKDPLFSVCCVIFLIQLARGNVANIFNPTKISSFATVGFHLKQDTAMRFLRGRVGAFGDFDSDMYTDMIWISQDSSKILVSRWDPNDNNFENPGNPTSLQAIITLPANVTDKAINIIPADFNYDGKLDLLVTATDSLSGESILLLYFGNNRHFTSKPLRLASSFGQTLVLEANGDMKPDLFGEQYLVGGDGKEYVARGFWLNTLSSWPDTCLNGIQDGEEEEIDCGGPCLPCPCLGFASLELCGFNLHTSRDMTDSALWPLSRTRAHSFADINGDCLADLILASEKDLSSMYEVWINRGPNGTIPNFLPPDQDLMLSLPNGAGSVTVADVNRDGSLDLVYAAVKECNYKLADRTLQQPSSPCLESQLLVAYNSRTDKDRPSGALCSGAAKNTIGEKSSTGLRVGTVVMSNADFAGSRLLHSNEILPNNVAGGQGFSVVEDFGMDPMMVRAGDYDLDGYVDLLLPLRDRDQQSRLALLVNTGGGKSFHRKVCASGCDLSDLNSIKGVYAGSFFDLNEKGNMDLVVLHVDSSMDLKVKILQSNFNDQGNLFLKAQGLNGVCPEWCPPPTPFPDPKPFGVNQHGVSFKYIMQDLSSRRLTAQAAQLHQSSHNALNLPYSMFGLGPASYYIEQFYMGVPMSLQWGLDRSYMSWMGVIPNSQLVVSPTDRANVDYWWIQAYVHPSEGIVYVAIVLAVTLLVLAASIWFLERREKYQDEMEKKLTAHAFL